MREIGTGGMSSVWLAERSDGVKRRVALKLPFVHPARAGYAERFVRERDILAALTHPHIARSTTPGSVHQGQPFLAMEFVKALPSSSIATRSGWECESACGYSAGTGGGAVAHSHLVIHRDISPRHPGHGQG